MTSFAKPRVFGTGFISLDLVLRLDPRSPVCSWAGGTCGNVLSILAYLGWDAYPIARMNGDPASERVKADMAQWGVHLDFTSCGPTAHTPIIIQEIKRGRDGKPKHRFSWSCPKCGKWLPSFRPVTTAAVDTVTPELDNTSVFFFDRLSRAALSLAKEAAERGAVVVFEPSGKGNYKLMAEAVSLAHIVKYADQRLASIEGVMDDGAATIVEVQTLGEQGLKYRHRFRRSSSEWIHVNALPAPRLTDACGSGDWCTAGLLAKVATRGLVGLREGGADGLSAALRYGQALAAWNCGFEGARGGMYAVDSDSVDTQVAALLAGQFEDLADIVDEPKSGGLIDCPACSPPSPRRRRVASQRTRRAAA